MRKDFPTCGPLSFLPMSKARGTQKRTEMEEHRDTLENGSTSSANDANGSNSVQSVERALDLLEFLCPVSKQGRYQ